MIAVVAAVAIWSFQQPTVEVPKETRTQQPDHTPQASNTGSAKGDLRTLFSADDYPAAAQRNGEAGTVQAKLFIGPDGKVQSCTVIRSSNSAVLDDATCSILRRRARFTPARDVNGMAVSDTVTTPPVVWRLEG